MAAQEKISLTEENDKWLDEQVECKLYASKNEAVNDLLHQIHENEKEYILAKLKASKESVEKYGWVEKTPEEIIADFKAKARRNGKL